MYQNPPTLDERLGSDTLSEEVRKQRRNLELVAVVGLIVVLLNLVPTRISALGVDLGKPKQDRFLWILVAFNLWFLFVFAIYALSDLTRRRAVLQQDDDEIAALREAERRRFDVIAERVSQARSAPDNDPTQEIQGAIGKIVSSGMRRRSRATLRTFSAFRLVVDYIVPVLLGLFALGALIWKIS